MSPVSPTRYRCTSCGNLTRFDVVTTRRTAAFHHFSVAGDLSIEDEQVLDEAIESVTCRWCGPAGAVRALEVDEIADSGVIPDELIRGALEAALVVAIKDPLGAPKPLQPFLKFQKMPARAMPVVRKVLDTDEPFRTRVASVVTLDLLDPPAVLFLTRPESWEDDLERLAAEEAKADSDAREEKAEKSAQRKLRAAEVARTKAEDRAKDLGVELDRARAMLEQERVARRQAETTAHNVTWDVDNLRKQVRELEAAADSWAQERAELIRGAPTIADAAPPEPAAPLDLSGVVDALRDARRSLEESARAIEHALAAVPDTPSAAAAGDVLTEERRVRPSKHAVRPEPLPGGVLDDSDDAARHLIGLRHVVVVVDGYNVAKRAWPELPSLVDQRDRLVDRLVRLHASSRAEVWIVFDGTEAGAIAASKGQPVTLVFTEAGVSADDEILRLVPTVPRERPVVVASSDREVADGARRLGANVISAEQLLAVG